MNDLVIQAMSPPAIQKVRRLEQLNALRPQVDIRIEDTLHAGMYARTAYIPAGVLITGALIKVATILIVSGDVVAYGERGAAQYVGYHVIPAEAGRKMAFYALQETALTMLFPTNAKTVDEAEAEFTDETDLLTSRRDDAGNTLGIS